eukprot:SM000319S12281  [mRNA]  locus=s319:114387:117067:- [translate_table: standard]
MPSLAMAVLSRLLLSKLRILPVAATLRRRPAPLTVRATLAGLRCRRCGWPSSAGSRRWRSCGGGGDSGCLGAAGQTTAATHKVAARDDGGSGTVHVPVLLSDVLAAFAGLDLRAFVDGTLGAAGHAVAVLEAHPEMEAFVGLDVDPVAHAAAEPRLQTAARRCGDGGPPLPQVHLLRSNFGDMKAALQGLGLVGAVSGILLDIGVSSMQIDTAERGFSFMLDGPLDMRMDPTIRTYFQGQPLVPKWQLRSKLQLWQGSLTAEQIVNDWPEVELGRVLHDFGEELRWRALARRITEARAEGPIRTTARLAGIIGGPHRPKGAKGRPGLGLHPATRTFQALRIAVNDELGVLERVIPDAVECLAPGGRLAIISFHSLEDRIVKRAFLSLAATAGSSAPIIDDYSVTSTDYLHVPGQTRYSSYRQKRGLAEIASNSNYEGNKGSSTGTVGIGDGHNTINKAGNVHSGGLVRILTKRPIVAKEAEQAANPRSRSAKLRVAEKL